MDKRVKNSRTVSIWSYLVLIALCACFANAGYIVGDYTATKRMQQQALDAQLARYHPQTGEWELLSIDSVQQVFLQAALEDDTTVRRAATPTQVKPPSIGIPVQEGQDASVSRKYAGQKKRP